MDQYHNPIDTAVGDAHVRAHLKENLRKHVYDARQDALKYMKDHEDVPLSKLYPNYLSPDVWASWMKYWESDKFKNLSRAGTENRSKGRVMHTTGAMPFVQKRRVIYCILD